MKFPTAYEEFIYLRTYSRWDYDKNRRENWDETVDRYISYMLGKIPDKCRTKYVDAAEFIGNREVMPSMRALWDCWTCIGAREHKCV